MLLHLVELRGAAELVMIVCGFITTSDTFHITHIIVTRANVNIKILVIAAVIITIFIITMYLMICKNNVTK